jgi:tRNA threonylcarbamoyladenosine biosynthesis protein TsaB
LGVISTRGDEPYSSRLFRHLQFLLGELSLKLEDFDLFAVCSGPGSFTGLRVGLTAVKGWAEVYRKPVAAISGLQAVAAQCGREADVVIPVLDARRGQVYAGGYRGEGGAKPHSAECDEQVMTPAEFFERLSKRQADSSVPSSLAIATPDPALLGDALHQFQASSAWARTIRVELVSPILAPHIARLGALRAARQDRLDDALTLDANYVRRSDAELHWKPPAGL